MVCTFTYSVFNNNSLNTWDISNCYNFLGIFFNSQFSGDISSWQFNKGIFCDDMFTDNKNFKDKYNNGKLIPYETNKFLEWFEENKDKIKELNTSKEEVLDFFSFENIREIS